MAWQKATIAFAAEQAPLKAAQLMNAENEDGTRAGTQPRGECHSCPSFGAIEPPEKTSVGQAFSQLCRLLYRELNWQSCTAPIRHLVFCGRLERQMRTIEPKDSSHLTSWE